MDKLKQHINNQLESNRGKNLLAEDSDSDFSFIKKTEAILESIERINKAKKNSLVAFVTDKAIEEFCKLNQYYSFDDNAKKELSSIYNSLFDNLSKNPSNDLKTISTNHYKNLKGWLVKSNPFAKTIYKDKEIHLDFVPCSDYSAETQLELLNIKLEAIQEPILDIGCGTSKHLVQYLHSLGYDVFGIDRFTNNSTISKKVDWLEFDYGINHWGTIISNLGFSNHFKHHHLRPDGNYVEYAKTYMAILNSLKKGGSFYYAPDLTFIETFLDVDTFKTERHKILNTGYNSVILKKLK